MIPRPRLIDRRLLQRLPFQFPAVVLVAAALAASPAGAAAQVPVLDGHVITTKQNCIDALGNGVGIEPSGGVVGPGVEMLGFGWHSPAPGVWVGEGFVDIDFSDTRILITARVDQPPILSELFSFTDWHGMAPDFLGVTVGAATSWPGVGASRVSWQTESIFLDLSGLGVLAGQQVELLITAAGELCQKDLGYGGPGATQLAVCGGDLTSGTTAELRLTAAPSFAPGLILVGLGSFEVPFKGGTLVPVPWVLAVPFTTGAGGDFTIPAIAGGGAFSVILQAIVLDPAQPADIGISNALRVKFAP